MNTVEQILEEIDRLIQSGQVGEAVSLLKSIETKKFSSLQVETLASFYRRLNLHRKALQILRPLVIGTSRRVPQSSAKAKIEYGAALIQMDLVEAGRLLLSLPEVRSQRDAKRWHALSFLHDFQFEKAAEEIENFLHDFSTPSYDRLVMKINLMVSLLADLHQTAKLTRFEKIAQEVKRDLNQYSAERLRSALASLCTQAVFFSESGSRLSVENSSPRDYLDFFAQFTSVFHEGRAGRLKMREVNRHYHRLREHALHQKWVEGLREIDFHYARVFEPNLLPLLKMGTHHVHYQNRYLKSVVFERVFCFTRTGPLNRSMRMSVAHPVLEIPGTPKLRKLFQLLYSEHYSLLTPFAIWSVLNPNEHFIEPHSTNCVHQWMKRLKIWLRKKRIPAVIHSSRFGYQLVPKQALVCDARLLNALSSEELFKLKLKDIFQRRPLLSIHEIRSLTPELGLREIQMRLKSLKEDQVIESIGRARGVRYRLKRDQKSG